MSSRFLLAGLLLLLSCSIKENRELCPCALSIELTHLPGPVTVQVVAGEHRASYTARNDTVMLVQAPKGKIRLQAVSGVKLDPEEQLNRQKQHKAALTPRRFQESAFHRQSRRKGSARYQKGSHPLSP